MEILNSTFFACSGFLTYIPQNFLKTLYCLFVSCLYNFMIHVKNLHTGAFMKWTLCLLARTKLLVQFMTLVSLLVLLSPNEMGLYEVD